MHRCIDHSFFSPLYLKAALCDVPYECFSILMRILYACAAPCHFYMRAWVHHLRLCSQDHEITRWSLDMQQGPVVLSDSTRYDTDASMGLSCCHSEIFRVTVTPSNTLEEMPRLERFTVSCLPWPVSSFPLYSRECGFLCSLCQVLLMWYWSFKLWEVHFT